jgi:hypothetical protein
MLFVCCQGPERRAVREAPHATPARPDLSGRELPARMALLGPTASCAMASMLARADRRTLPDMTHDQRAPELGFIVPGANENRWSDLLATLIKTDPGPMARLIGAEVDGVQREVVATGTAGHGSDRIDLLLGLGETTVAAIEVKVLSDLGLGQLNRYETAFADAASYFVLHLGQLPLSLPQPWRALTWEAVMTAYAASEHVWVATTAGAWLAQLTTLVPSVDAETVWNAVPDDTSGFELALRARVAWLAARMSSWSRIESDLQISSGGGAWVAAMRAPATTPEHFVIAEIQEGLPAVSWRFDPARTYWARLVGPVVLVGLSQLGPSTSAGFDWSLLHRLFREYVLDGDGRATDGRRWQTTAASPRDPTDRANWRALVEAGGPPWLGKGYGNATAKTHGVCAFGGRFQLGPTLTLGQIDAELERVQDLVLRMAGPFCTD